ncbi:MAG: hypothetical protein ABI155_09240 [Paralcaligenes sp.]
MIGILAAKAGTSFLDRVVFSVQVVFRAIIEATDGLLGIMVVIALMVAMLDSLKLQKVDQMIVAPLKKIMTTPVRSFFILGITMYLFSIFFWPTPSTAIVGTIVLPFAVSAGLPRMAATIAENLFGHGMALAADPIIQGAAHLTGTAAGVSPGAIVPWSLLFSFIIGAIAIGWSFIRIRREMKSGVLVADPPGTFNVATSNDSAQSEISVSTKYAKVLAVGVPLIFLLIVLLIVTRALFDPAHAIKGEKATQLIGGTAMMILVISTLLGREKGKIDTMATHLRAGFFFALRIFTPILPIAAFFFLGQAHMASKIIGAGAPGYLFDFATLASHHLALDPFTLVFGISFIGMLTGLDGSGFSGLPLVGALAGSLGTAAHLNVVVLASAVQVAEVFFGSGCAIAWSFGAAADAGVGGVDVNDLVRRNLVPVLVGTVVMCVVAGVLLKMHV